MASDNRLGRRQRPAGSVGFRLWFRNPVPVKKVMAVILNGDEQWMKLEAARRMPWRECGLEQ
jgi:hypothetical protein